MRSDAFRASFAKAVAKPETKPLVVFSLSSQVDFVTDTEIVDCKLKTVRVEFDFDSLVIVKTPFISCQFSEKAIPEFASFPSQTGG